MRNPNWTKEELILLLHLYSRSNFSDLSIISREVMNLSKLLRSLPIYPDEYKDYKFRSPNMIMMKLRNFLLLEPDYKGKLINPGTKAENEVWDEFRNSEDSLQNEVDSILQKYDIAV